MVTAGRGIYSPSLPAAAAAPCHFGGTDTTPQPTKELQEPIGDSSALPALVMGKARGSKAPRW